MNYFRIPLEDKEIPKEKAIEDFLKYVKDEKNWPVFVHCRAG